MNTNPLSQVQCIVAAMVSQPHKTIWYAKDFMPPERDFNDPFFVGYEASARMSDLLRMYPYMFEAGKQGKYRTLRFKFEDKHAILAKCYDDMKQVIIKHLVI